MSKKITPAEYEQWLAEHRPDITALEAYQSAKTKIMHRHSCGFEWEVAPEHIKGGRGCPECKIAKLREVRLITPAQYEKWLSENRPDLAVLEPYQDARTPIPHLCSRGHHWVVTPDSVKRGNLCSHCNAEDRGGVVRGTWTREACKADALNYQSIKAWSMSSASAYNAARKHGCLDECTAHMGRSAKPAGWFDDRLNWPLVISDARLYQSISDWQRGSASIHCAAIRRPELYALCTAHMERLCKPRGWFDDRSNWPLVISDARLYQTIADWKRDSGAMYNSALKRPDLFVLCTAHMERLVKPDGWYDDRLNWPVVIADARTYQTISEWQRGSSMQGSASHRPELYALCTAHMERVCVRDSNSLYAWRVLSAKDEVVVPLPGFHLVKFGVTSQRQNGARIKGVAKKNGMEQEVIGHCDTSEDENRGHALDFEAVLKGLGTDPQLPYWYDGRTEFRLISDEELGLVKQLMGVQEGALAKAA